MSTENNNFPSGIFFKLPQPSAPDFVKGKVSIKLAEAIAYLQAQAQSGEQWLNLNVKVSKAGKGYLEVDTWKPQSQGGQAPQQTGQPTGGFDMQTGEEVPF